MFGNLTTVVKNLLLINVVVFFINLFLDGFLNDKLSFYSYLSENFAPYQLFTYMFLHGGGFHLFSNMLGLFVFGPMLERFWGSTRFLKFYLITGIGAGLIYSFVNLYEFNKLENEANHYIENPSPGEFYAFLRNHYPNYTRDSRTNYVALSYAEDPENESLIKESIYEVSRVANSIITVSSMLGASGAIFGILLAFGMLFPNTELFLLFPPIPIKAKYLVTFYGLYTIYAGIQKAPGDNVAHFAHLGGMVIAYILLKIWQNKRNSFY